MRVFLPTLVILAFTGCIDPYIIDTGNDADTDTDTDSDTDSDTDTDTDSDTDTDTDTDTGDGILRIHEVVDHADSAQVKYVELHNRGTGPVSMNGLFVTRYANGDTSGDSVQLPNQLLPADGTYVVCNSAGAEDFETLFGRAPSSTSSSINGNGDDVYAITDTSGNVLDVFGVIGVDGDGQSWEYTDSVAKRGAAAGPSSTFIQGEWNITSGTSAANPFSPF